MSKKITVSVSFDFYPDTEHADIFEDMTPEDTIRVCKELANDDISNAAMRGEIWDNLVVTESEE